jgi:dodecin
MANVVRTIEVEAESEKGWEDAAALAVVNLGRQLLKSIHSIHLEDLRAGDDNAAMLGYRVEAKISLSRSRPTPALPTAAHAQLRHDRNRRAR